MRRRLVGALLAVAAVLVGVALVTSRGDGGGSAVDGVRAAAGVTTTTSPAPSSTTAAGESLPTTAPAGTVTTSAAAATGATTRPSSATTVATSETTVGGATGRVAEGTWGGPGIRLVVGSGGGTIEYDCASGVISQALVVDGTGSFQAEGSHSFQSGGPVQPGTPAPASRPARYTGTVNGRQMQLTVVLPQVGTTLGPFTLGLDQQPLLDRCG